MRGKHSVHVGPICFITTTVPKLEPKPNDQNIDECPIGTLFEVSNHSLPPPTYRVRRRWDTERSRHYKIEIVVDVHRRALLEVCATFGRLINCVEQLLTHRTRCVLNYSRLRLAKTIRKAKDATHPMLATAISRMAGAFAATRVETARVVQRLRGAQNRV
jgi:hypothetical protein